MGKNKTLIFNILSLMIIQGCGTNGQKRKRELLCYFGKCKTFHSQEMMALPEKYMSA